MFDDIDTKILTIIQDNARVTNVEIARQVGMVPSAVLDRLRKLETRGIIQGYETRLDPRGVGMGLLAFVFVRTNERLGEPETAGELARIPEVLEVHHVAGEDCYLVKVRVADTDALGSLLREKFGAIPTIRSTRTTIVLATVKETMRIPVQTQQEYSYE